MGGLFAPLSADQTQSTPAIKESVVDRMMAITTSKARRWPAGLLLYVFGGLEELFTILSVAGVLRGGNSLLGLRGGCI